jgi:hypothetical protein
MTKTSGFKGPIVPTSGELVKVDPIQIFDLTRK